MYHIDDGSHGLCKSVRIFAHIRNCGRHGERTWSKLGDSEILTVCEHSTDRIFLNPVQSAGPKPFFKQPDLRFRGASKSLRSRACNQDSLFWLQMIWQSCTGNVQRPPMKMDWLPTAPDFRDGLRAALNSLNSADSLEKLATLAQYRLGFQETLQLGQALDRLPFEPIVSLTTIRLAVLTSVTASHLRPAIRVAGLRRKMWIDVYTGGYGQYQQELLDSTSALHRFIPQIILFNLTARDIIASVPLTATAEEVDEAIRRYIEELRRLWRKARETFKATIIQQTFIDITEPIFGSYDRLVPGAPATVVAKLNDLLSEAAAQDAVSLLDVARASEREGN